jgi:hypothetical protein
MYKIENDIDPDTDILTLMPLDLFVHHVVFPLLPAVHILKILSKAIKRK